MKTPSFQKCVAVHLARVLLFAVAWFMVPLGMLLRAIKKGPLVRGQWNGAVAQPDGTHLYGTDIESIVCRGPFVLFDLPDEPGITLYEPTVAKIYRRFGWYGAVYYNLAFRNVGHGWFNLFRVELDRKYAPEELLKTCLGIKYGLKAYEDWRAYPDQGAHNSEPRLWYAIPALFES